MSLLDGLSQLVSLSLALSPFVSLSLPLCPNVSLGLPASPYSVDMRESLESSTNASCRRSLEKCLKPHTCLKL